MDDEMGTWRTGMIEVCEENCGAFLARMAGRRLAGPQMCRTRMSLPEWMMKSSEARKEANAGARLPPLQPIMPSTTPSEGVPSTPSKQMRNSMRPTGTPRRRRDSKPTVEKTTLPSPKRKPLSVELDRRRNHHPRLRFPRLAMHDQSDLVSQEGSAPSASARSSTGIVKDLSARNEAEPNYELEASAAEFLKLMESAGEVIGPGSLFYPGFDLPIEPQWQSTSLQRQANKRTTPAPLEVFPDEEISEDPHSNQPALLERPKPCQELAVGNAATVHLSRLDGNMLDHQERAKKGGSSAIDRKYHLRQAPFSHIMARTTMQRKGGSHSSKGQASTGQSSSEPPRSRQGKKSPGPPNPLEPKTPSSEYLNFESWGIDDEYVALLCARAKLETIRFINMSDNRITSESINLMATSKVPWRLESLQIRGNRLYERGGRAVARLLDAVRPPLKQLDISDNLIGDKACEDLCENLMHTCYASLHGLVLAHNEIGHGDKAGTALGSLVASARELEVLDLHWNFFHGAGATALLNGIYENGCTIGGKLRRLNLAWNRLGMRCGEHSLQAGAVGMAAGASGTGLGGGGEAPASSSGEIGLSTMAASGKAKLTPVSCSCSICAACTRMAKMLASLLQDGAVLFHVDLSYNGICAADCGIIGDGLKLNHTLFGLHLVGNEAAVDELGFVVPLRPGEYIKQEDMREKANRLVENIPVKLRLDGTPLVLREKNTRHSSIDRKSVV